MSKSKFKYIYGPVYSWRLGMSLGIDPLSTLHKACNFDCTYCQLGKTEQYDTGRKEYVSSEDIIEEVKALPSDIKIDYYTFSGRGEPTLAKNLGEMIAWIKTDISRKVAVITNSTLLGRLDVQEDLALADFVLVKLDATNEDDFRKINRPAEGINFESVLVGIQSFRRVFKGKMGLQVMITVENKNQVAQLADLAKTIEPDEIQLNTPLRPSASAPLAKQQMEEIKKYFLDLPLIMVYDAESQVYLPLDDQSTRLRHGEFK